MLTVVAFDPGNSPSACVFRGDASFKLYEPMGVSREITRQRTNDDGVKKAVKGKTNTPDTAAILAIYREWLPDIVVVEQVNLLPKQGIASGASFMRAAGLLEGIAYGVSLNGITRLTKLRPQTWRSAWSMPPGKEQSRLVATRIFPSRSADFKQVKSHNVADPLLMALYVWCHESGVPLPR